MLNLRKIAALFLVAVLTLAPTLASARAGAAYGSGGSSYSSLGSRGSRTYSTLNGAAPIQRSVTPANPSGYAGTSAWGRPAYGYSGGGFMRGLAGGLFGAWIGSMLFGGSAYGYDGGAMHAGGFFGTFLMFLALFFVCRFLWRGFAGGLPRMNPGFAMPNAGYQPMPRMAQGPVALGQSDFDMFGQVLTQVQAGWSHGDLDRLRRYCTPEMLSYFSEMMSNNASQGVANRIENVALLQGEPRESWSEGGVEYATVYLRWSALDYTHRIDRGPGASGWLVEGDSMRPVEEEEIWTFRRAGGGRWLLSAIQQIG